MARIADDPRPADRGSITLFAVIFTMAVIFLALMLADFGNRMNAEERAADTAEQAARAAADTLNPADLRTGQVVIDGAAACEAATTLVNQYKNLSGIDATLTNCTAGDPIPRQATVTVMVTTTPILSAFLTGGYTVKVTESACAEFGITTGAAC
jgi:Flp pilus assembly protein TadG